MDVPDFRKAVARHHHVPVPREELIARVPGDLLTGAVEIDDVRIGVQHRTIAFDVSISFWENRSARQRSVMSNTITTTPMISSPVPRTAWKLASQWRSASAAALAPISS